MPLISHFNPPSGTWDSYDWFVRTSVQLVILLILIAVFNKDLEKKVMSDTSGNFERLLVSLLQCKRDESKTFDRNQARKDAEDLLTAGEKKRGTDESR